MAERSPDRRDWCAAPDEVEPTVLILGGLLTSPPLYYRMRRRLLERGAADVVIAPVWLPDWLLAIGRGVGPIVTRSGRSLLEAGALAALSGRSRGAPVLVVGHSAGGLIARLLTSPEPFEGRRLGAAGRMGAIVTLGTPHRITPSGWAGRRLAESANAFVDRVAPGPAFAPTTGYLAVAAGGSLGRLDGSPREVGLHRVYGSILAEGGAPVVDGDGLIPVASALLPGADSELVEGIVHGQLRFSPWYGSDEALDVWWPRALETWHRALLARCSAAIETARVAR